MLNSLLAKLSRNSRVRVHGKHSASVFRQCQNRYLKERCASLGARRVLNVGAQPNSVDKEGECYEDYFPQAEFFTLDLTPAQHPRHIVADLMDLSNVNQKFDLILMMSVLEHVEKPFLAAEKLRKLMTDDGYLYLTLPFFYPVHEGPHFGDFWRFTPAAISQVFDYCDVVSQDHYPSVIRAVADRKNYWNEAESTYTGFSVLLRNQQHAETKAA